MTVRGAVSRVVPGGTLTGSSGGIPGIRDIVLIGSIYILVICSLLCFSLVLGSLVYYLAELHSPGRYGVLAAWFTTWQSCMALGGMGC